jgi:hypothetical protein
MEDINKVINPVTYDIRSVLLTADRWSLWDEDDEGFEIRKFVHQITFYESLNKAYLTAAMVFLDNQSLSSRLNFTGTERVEIKIMTDEEQSDEKLSITKRFIITEILSSEKVGDNNEMISVHLIEERAYQSYVSTINRSFKKILSQPGDKGFAGNPVDIIQNLLRTLDRSHGRSGYFLDNTLMYNESPDQLPLFDGEMNIIIPNLPAIDAVTWITNRCITSSGLPFYSFASMGDDRIRFFSLEAMLKMDPINSGQMAYTYAFQLLSSAQTVPNGMKSYLISDFDNTGTDNQLAYSRTGAGTSSHNFIDTYSGEIKVVNFDPERMFEHLHDQNILGKNDLAVYDSKLKFGNKTLSELNSAVVTNISTSKTFSNTKRGVDDKKRSYNEVGNTDYHALKIEAGSARAYLQKTGLKIKVPGRNFLAKNSNMTVGNKINVEFRKNIVQEKENPSHSPSDLIDLKRSGQYIIHNAEHTFNDDDGYTVILVLVRLALQKR